MLYQASEYTSPDATLTADVCIVGSGAAGITLAHRLLESGKSVLVLEGSVVSTSGNVTDAHLDVLRRHGTYPPEVAHLVPSADDWYCPPRAHAYYDLDAQELYGGTEDPDLEAIDPAFLTCSRVRVYGGTTNCWGGWTRPLTPIDFDRSDLSSFDVWPITRDALFPDYYATAMEYCFLDGVNPGDYDDPSAWVGNTRVPFELMPITEASDGQLQNAGFTTMDSSKLRFQLTWGPDLERADDSTCIVLRNANVRQVETVGGGGSVARLLVSTIDESSDPPAPGFDFYVEAGTYVLATGGTEGSRLLLNSASGGLANDYGMLGKCFMFHPLNTAAASFDIAQMPSQGIVTAYSSLSARLKNSVYPTVWVTLTPTDNALTTRGLRNFRIVVSFSQWGQGGINVNWEQAPNLDSQLILDDNVDPIFGDPLVRLNWEPTTADTTTTPQKAVEMVQSALDNLGYADSNSWSSDPVITWDGDHHMGATRMSATPETGYVDGDCLVHGVDNLYICSSSVWATSGYANPTLTIVAFALRLGDRIASS